MLVQYAPAARYGADGILDGTFGTDGAFTDASAAMSIRDLAVDPRNRILVSGWPWPHSRRGFGAWRFLDDGDADQDFGTGGTTRTGTVWAAARACRRAGRS